MYHLLLAVLAIALTAAVSVGGMYYGTATSMNAVTANAAIAASTGYRQIEMAFGSYRVANGGAMPTTPASAMEAVSDEATWRLQVAPYGIANLIAPYNMRWYYGMGTDGGYVCLSNDKDSQGNSMPISDATAAGVARSLREIGDGVLTQGCGGQKATGGPSNGSAAWTYSLQSGG